MSYYHHLIKSAPSMGALTTAWITATSETNPTIISALNTLETDLTTYGLTAKIKALYPMVGGTAAKHKFNFMDARDLDAAFRLTFSGGWVHSANGALGNGVNTQANSYFNQLNNFTNFYNGGIGIYSRTDETGVYLEGCSGANGSQIVLYPKYPTAGLIFQGGDVAVYYNSTPNSLGLITGTSISNSDRRLYKNGTKVGTDTAIDTFISGSGLNIFFGCRNANNINGLYFGNKQYAMCLITEGMNDTNQANLYTATQAFQTTLGRQVSPYPASLKLFIDAGNAASYPGTGTTVTDLTTNNNNCTLLNGTGYSSSNGGIFTFDGVNDNISTPIYSTVTEMSGMFWLNLSSYALNPPLLVDVGQGYIELKINTAGQVTWGNFGSTTANGATTISINTWYAVGFSHKTGQKSKVYLNGILDGSSSGNQNNIGNNSAALKFMTNSVLFSSGKLGNVKIFNAQMTDADFLGHFNEFKSRYGY